MKTREQALVDLGRVVAESAEISSRLTPLQAAERAWHPGGPSVAVLAARIAASRERRTKDVQEARTLRRPSRVDDEFRERDT